MDNGTAARALAGLDNETLLVGYSKHSWDSLERSTESLLLILATFSSILLARVLTHRLLARPSLVFGLEFVLIVLPTLLLVTVASDYSSYFVGLMFLLSLWYIWHSRALHHARHRTHFDLGGARPTMITLARALTHLITAICILAIDFTSFYRPYRKTWRFGAHLMDTGIGLFVITMGLVSRRARNVVDIRRGLLYSALPVLLLGLARTVSLRLVGFGQNPHEYGQDLNAFFILGLSKMFGCLISRLARKDVQLLPLALGILVCHQMALTGGLSNYVMDYDSPRDNFISANREGLSSLPGFVAIYLISIYLSRWLVSRTLLTYVEMVEKLKRFLYMVIICWLLFVICVFAIGIARVTCNLGYVVWMFAITMTILWLSLFAGDFIINSVLPLDPKTAAQEEQEKGVADTATKVGPRNAPFVICESLNMNGLIFFLLANLLTGAVNLFLQPDARSNVETILILLIYMLVATKIVHELFRRGIRLA